MSHAAVCRECFYLAVLNTSCGERHSKHSTIGPQGIAAASRILAAAAAARAVSAAAARAAHARQLAACASSHGAAATWPCRQPRGSFARDTLCSQHFFLPVQVAHHPYSFKQPVCPPY
eukprot:4300836-Pleurochrysis_carterae.AAC.3